MDPLFGDLSDRRFLTHNNARGCEHHECEEHEGLQRLADLTAASD